MPTRILLADDSMTAQKLGKDILTAAGYEVTAVSNGAVAAKKLADKFDVIILDINMPGYTGIELCEKIRANMDIAKTPVLLTIGKMEHYEPSDAQRVKADGVIVKPFEASDLLAAVQKLEKKAAPAVPDYEKTVILKRSEIEEFKDQSYADWKSEAEEEVVAPAAATSAGFDMTHAQASAPAFGMDFGEPGPAMAAEPAMETPAAPPAMAFETTAAPSMGFDMGGVAAPAVGFDMQAPAVELSPVESERMESLMTPPSFEGFATATAPAVDSTLEPTVAAPVLIASSVDPNLDLPSQEAPEAYAIPAKDPALADRLEMASDEFITKIGTPESETDTELVTEESSAQPNADMDFEAKVAAAMSGLDAAEEMPAEVDMVAAEPEIVPEPTPEPPGYERTQLMEARSTGSFEIADAVPIEAAVPEPETSQSAPEGSQDAILVEQMHAAIADLPAEITPHVVEEPIAAAEQHPSEPAAVAAVSSGPDMELASALAAAVGAEVPASSVAAAASAGTGKTVVDPNVIAQAVHRAMARMMPAIMTEVAKELDSENK